MKLTAKFLLVEKRFIFYFYCYW